MRQSRRTLKSHLCNLLLMIIGSVIQAEGTKNVPVDITAGALFRQLPNVTLYETTVPIVFKIPYQPGKDLTLMYQYLQETCNESCRESKEILRRAVSNWNWNNWANTFGESHLSKDGTAFATSFALPERRHTGRMVITEQEANNMEQDLRELGGKWDMEMAPLTVRPSYPCSTKNGDVRLRLLEVLTLIRTQADILRSCQNRRLDPMLVDVNNLKDKLILVSQKVRLDGYELAIKHLSRYYILSMMDCLLSPSHLYLILLLPLKRQHFIPSLYTFLPIPFAREGYTCGIKMQATDFAILAEPRRIQIKVLDCDPHKDELCLLGDPLGETLTTVRCAETMVKGGSAAKLTSVCPIDCVPSSDMVVTKISTTTYVITNPPANAMVQCEWARNRSNWAAENVGAYKVDLPCDCVLQLGDAEFRPQYPCLSASESVTIRRIIPAPWASIPSLSLPPYDSLNFATCEVLRDCVKSSWKPITPVTINYPTLAMCSLIISSMSLVGTVYIVYRILKKRSLRTDPFITSTPRENRVCTSFKRPICPRTIAPKPPPIETLPSRRPPAVLPRPIYMEIKEPDYLPMRDFEKK